MFTKILSAVALLALFSCSSSSDLDGMGDIPLSGDSEVEPDDVPADPDAMPEGDTTSQILDIGGRWALLQISSALAQIPIVGMDTRTTYTVLLVDHSQKDGLWEARMEVCLLRIEAETTLVRTVIPDAFVAALEPFVRPVELAIQEDGLVRYVQPDLWQAWGADLPDPQFDSLPNSPEDPRVTDPDKDGRPGLTVRVTGLMTGELYVVQRRMNSLEGSLTDTGTVQGLHRSSMEQNVLGGDNPDLVDNDPETFPDPNPENSTFRMVKMPQIADCKDLVSLVPDVFPEVPGE